MILNLIEFLLLIYHVCFDLSNTKICLFVFLSVVDTCLVCNSDLTSASTTKKRPLNDAQDDEDERIHNLSSNHAEKNVETTLSHLTTRLSTTNQFEDKIWVLDDAIRQGNVDLALHLIENTNSFLEQMNFQRETPLLLAAKFNRTELIEQILQKRPELIQQTDKLGNNIFHILARITNDQAKQTIEDILTKLDYKTKHFLVKQLNHDEQIPKQVAVNQNNLQCAKLFS